MRYWVHSRFLLVEGEKMAKSAGNFYTVRDLVLMGHKPSSIRFLLMSVPHHKQLNFTFDGLTQAANSVERLRNFKLRLQTSKFEAGSNPSVAELAEKASAEMRAGMEDDLNTARALGAVFDMVRDVNAAIDGGQVKQEDVPKILKALEQFDEIFAVLQDDDAAKVRATVEWATAEGKRTRSARRQPRSRKPRRCRMRRSRSWWRNIRRRGSRGISRGRMRSGTSWRRTESCWRTQRTG